MKRFITAAFCGAFLAWLLGGPLIQKLYGDEVLLLALGAACIPGSLIIGWWWKDGWQ